MAPSTASGEPKWRSSARLRLGPDARQLVHDRLGHRLVAPDPVVRDREPVRLVAHALEQLQLGRVVRQPQRLAHAGHEDLLDPLGQRDDRDAALAEALGRASSPAESWPGPPSITIRFGSAANDASRSAS